MEEDDESVTTQSSNSADNEESNITSTTEDILDSLPEVPCDPTACTPPAGYEFCQALPAGEGECCPSQYECNNGDDVNGTTQSSNSEEKDESNFTSTAEDNQTEENVLLDEDDINLGSQSRNIEENNELNITSTTKAIIEHLTNVPCDPSACTSLPGYEFCQPLLSEERECCPSQ